MGIPSLALLFSVHLRAIFFGEILSVSFCAKGRFKTNKYRKLRSSQVEEESSETFNTSFVF